MTRIHQRFFRRRTLVAALVSGLAAAGVVTAGPSLAATNQRVDLRVLVVTDGNGPVQALERELASEGVPYTRVDLNSATRPIVTPSFLSDVISGTPRAKFQAVVLPNERPYGMTDAEMTALASFERTFSIRQVDAYTWANPAVGLNYAADPGYAGDLDGAAATLTGAGLSGAFRYLNGPVTFQDDNPGITESYGFLATPLPTDPATGAGFTPLLTAPIPGDPNGTVGSLMGVYSRDGREDLVLTFNYLSSVRQFQVLAHGIVTWMTRGVHLGFDRNYFTVHVDDLFLPDSRWSTTGRCTPGDDCPLGTPDTPDIRMGAADVNYLVGWQNTNNFKLTFAYNGAGSDDAVATNGSDPLTAAVLANRSQFGFVNHTYEHLFLGCLQDFTVVPWRCVTDATTGAIQYMSQANIQTQISRNATWAKSKGLPIDTAELVTGEHSGLRTLPQQPDDNPNLAPALAGAGVKVLASDNSREPSARPVGNALTVPRYPMNIFYNVGTKAEEVDEYNWIYTRRADGGSGICEDNPGTTTCITPLTTSDFDTYIAQIETAIALRHVLGNDPRPHYAHQSNLTEDRILLPVLEKVLAGYRAAFAANAPLVSTTMRTASSLLTNQTAWPDQSLRTTAYTLNGRLYLSTTNGSALAPVTVPTGTTTAGSTTTFGEAYAGERSAWTNVPNKTQLTYVLGTASA